jgi:hypothetical protein
VTREMSEQEIRAVYAIATTYDNRKTSESNITAWWEQAIRNRWTLDEVREAIHQHHGQSTEFLMPAHITAIIRANRRQPEKFDSSKLLPAAPPADPERIGEVVAAVAEELGWQRPPSAAEMDVRCPYCHAPPKRMCQRLMTRGPHRGEWVPLSSFHASRIDLAEDGAA